MPNRPTPLVQVPDGFPKITTGTMLAGGRTLVTGHKNGYVARWTVGSSKPTILLRASSEVYAVVQSRNGEVLVGCKAGDLFSLTGPNLDRAEQILPPTNTKYNRVFRIAYPLPSTLLFTSTYGTITLLKREQQTWSKTQLIGHSNAVFAVAHEGDRLLATGDYRGNIRIWEVGRMGFELRQRLVIDSYVSGLAFIGPQLLAAIGQSGHITLFEYQAHTENWRAIFETDAASGAGATVQPFSNNRFVLAATDEEIIQVDPVSQQVYSAKVKGAISLFPQGDNLFVLTTDGLVQVPVSDLAPKLDLVQYQYFKVGLLGNTSYGKSTLCSTITTGKPGSQLSTFGHRIWTWTVRPTTPQRRVLLNDNGGQEQVVETLLPLAADSDVVLFFFKQTEVGGFRTALQLHRRMKPLLSASAKSFLVETYTDHPLKAISDDHVASQMAAEGFDGIFKVSPTEIEQVEVFKREFLQKLDWSKARPAVQSTSAVELSKTIERLKRDGKTVSSVGEIQALFETTTKSSIYGYHLKFLLRNLTDTGQLEYYPTIGDTVILDDPEFNELRTNIPIFAGERGGVVRWADVVSKFPSKSIYLAMLDLFYTTNGVSIPFGNEQGRIFPAFLEQRDLNITAQFSPYVLNSGVLTVLSFSVPDVERATLLTALVDMELDCIDATKNEGLFAWGSNACLYYQLVPTQSTLEGPRLKVSFKTGGRDSEAANNLRSQFRKLLQVLYGEPLDSAEAQGS
jgi:WD40 repeat protein